MADASQDPKTQLLAAALPHVPFDGWSDATFAAAIQDTGIEVGVAHAVYPRGAVDLALAYHQAGDLAMISAMEAADLSEMRYSERVAFAVRARIEAVEDKEHVRRGMALFSLPHHAADGMQAIWKTCDKIWVALGDSSNDINWYSKRMTLSGVYGSTVLYWLGDDSPGYADTWDFLNRRIGDVMQIEKFKGQLRKNKVVGGLMAGPLAFLGKIKAPTGGYQTGMPGRWNGPQ